MRPALGTRRANISARPTDIHVSLPAMTRAALRAKNSSQTCIWGELARRKRARGRIASQTDPWSCCVTAVTVMHNDMALTVAPALAEAAADAAEVQSDGSGVETVVPEAEEEQCTPDAPTAPAAPWGADVAGAAPKGSGVVLATRVHAAGGAPATTPVKAATVRGARAHPTKKQAWSAEEDAQLLSLVERFGASCWSQIAAHLGGRIGKQCRERWHNHLAPEVKKEGFTDEEARRPLRPEAAPPQCAPPARPSTVPRPRAGQEDPRGGGGTRD